MKTILLFLALCLASFAQTSSYPGAVGTDATMFKAANNIGTRLIAAQAGSDTVAVVSDSTGITANMLISVGTTSPEIEAVCAVSGNTITLGYNGACPSITGRGFDGTSAVAHTANVPVNLNNVAWLPNMARKHIQAIETALGPNLSNIPVASDLNVTLYNFSPMNCSVLNVCAPGGASGGTLIAGNTQVAMQLVPLGMAGTDYAHYVWVTGGVGTEEGCLVAGGSGTPLQANGLIILTCANPHTGAFTIGPASFGLQEAVNVARTNGGGRIFIPGGRYKLLATVSIIGTGIDLGGVGGMCCSNPTDTLFGTYIYRTGDFGDSITLGSPNVYQATAIRLHDFTLSQYIHYQDGNPGTIVNKPTHGAHIHAWGTNTLSIERMHFENMYQNVVLTGVAPPTVVRDNSFTGLWVASQATLQVTATSLLINQTASGTSQDRGTTVPTNVTVDNNTFVGYPTSIPAIYSGAGPRQNIEVDACEDCHFPNNYTGGANVNNVLISGTSPFPILHLTFDSHQFDSAGVADFQIQSDGTATPTDITISNAQADGELAGATFFSVPNLGSGAPAVRGLTIANLHAFAYLSTPVLIMDGKGIDINGGKIWYYNTANTYATAAGSSSVYIGGRTYGVLAHGIQSGGGSSFEDYGAGGNKCNFGVQADPAIYPGNSIKFWGNYPPKPAALNSANWATDTEFVSTAFSYPDTTMTIKGNTSVTGSTTLLATNDTQSANIPIELRGSGVFAFQHVQSYGTAPGLTATGSTCGTTPTLVSTSTDNAGSFTTGSGTVSSCVVTFAYPFVNVGGTSRTPVCAVTLPSGAATPAFAASSSVITVTTAATSTVYNWTCQ